jgi:hypothetical protein
MTTRPMEFISKWSSTRAPHSEPEREIDKGGKGRPDPLDPYPVDATLHYLLKGREVIAYRDIGNWSDEALLVSVCHRTMITRCVLDNRHYPLRLDTRSQRGRWI